MSELEDLQKRVEKLEDENERIKNAIMSLCDAAVTAAAVGSSTMQPLEARKHLMELRSIIRTVSSEIYPKTD